MSQELSLFPDLTVRENLFPYRPPRRFGLLDRGPWTARPARSSRISDSTSTSPRRTARRTLPRRTAVGGDRAALLRRPRVLVLDEPTSALPAAAVDRLEQVLRTLTGQGIAVLYVTHFLEEVMRLARRVTVLRDGRVALPGVRREETAVPELVTAMLGARPSRRVARPGRRTRARTRAGSRRRSCRPG
ncbi:sugar ABC transporter ATP-binding protein [Streptomyces phaeolivaceus]|uniref:hypothetical protein n=1 Tax=Streptomyces phaeolivaceus TaxID=2653200 RepID=UPI001D048664|nr:hypothetical protein [Streptomyces phaeolivaceus]